MAGTGLALFVNGMLLTAEQTAEDTGRIFGLDAQLLFDVCVQGVAVFLLFIFLSYILINPVRKVLTDRQNKIEQDINSAAADKEEAARLKEEYDAKLKKADDEASDILNEARRKAVKNEERIVNEAKEEAHRIITGANKEAELEKSRVKDEVKQEIISVATVMAGKMVAGEMTDAKQNELIDQTLKEIGEDTWLNK